MGQEIGHAFEIILELALEEIITERSCKGIKPLWRISPNRRLLGVTGNLDHILEESQDGENWSPVVLFMEKHSDSSDNSHLHFRRHLEEYIQVKASSIQNYDYNINHTLPIINLIYGLELNVGWKPAIIQESKRLLFPTLFLPDKPFYSALVELVTATVAKVGSPYPKHEIAKSLRSSCRESLAFQAFYRTIHNMISRPAEPPPKQQKWLRSEITRTIETQQLKPLVLETCYLRKGLTHILALPSDIQQIVNAKVLRGSALLMGEDISPDYLRNMQLSMGPTTLRRRISKTPKITVSCSDEIQSLPTGAPVKDALNLACDVFLTKTNTWPVANRDYAAYFDICDKSFLDFVQRTVMAIGLLVQKNKAPLCDLLMLAPERSIIAERAFPAEVDRAQNLVIETILAVASIVAKQILDADFKLTTSTWSRHAGISEGKINNARGGKPCTKEFALGLVNGLNDFFCNVRGYSTDKALAIMNDLLNELVRWRNTSDPNEVVCVPRLINVNVTMSISWTRHNQLCAHSIFNPLSPMLRQRLERQTGAGWKLLGFPVSRSANPLYELFGNDFDGLDYEFTLLALRDDRKLLRILESSSVQGFKHTSDKCKELCARIRGVKAIISNKCSVFSELVVDGDWSSEHVRDLVSAGWDSVVYSRKFLMDWHART